MTKLIKYAGRAIALLAVMLGLMWLLGGRTHSTWDTVRVDAKADHVFPFLLEPKLRESWLDGVESIRPTNELVQAVGARSELTTVIHSTPVQVDEEILDLEPEQLLRVRSQVPWATWVTTFALEASNSGTQVHRRTYTEYHGLWRFWSLFAGDAIGDYQQNQLKSLQQVINASS